MRASFPGICLAAVGLLSCARPATGAEAVLTDREPMTLPPFHEISTRPFIDRYASEAEYDRARRDKRFVFERLTYSSDGLAVVALFYHPESAETPLPTVVFNRGSYVRNDTAPEYLTSFHRLAVAGYAVLAPMYRGSEGAGGRDEMGGDDLNDLMRIAALAEELPSVDTNNLFLLGESRGGMMVLQAIRDGFPARAAAVYGAPTDFRRLFRDAPDDYEPIADQLWPDWRSHREQLLDRRSAMAWAEKIDVPLLIMHGGKDRSMPVSQSLALAGRLQELGKSCELHVFADENHQISGRSAERDAEAVAWYGSHAPGLPRK